MIKGIEEYLIDPTEDNLFQISWQMDELITRLDFLGCDAVFAYLLEHPDVLKDVDLCYGLLNVGRFFQDRLPHYRDCLKAFRQSLLDLFKEEDVERFLQVVERGLQTEGLWDYHR